MEGKFDVFRGGEKVGTVETQHDGLYTVFSCRCRPAEDGIFRLLVTTEAGSESLGILIPAGEDLILCRKRPSSHFPGTAPRFFLLLTTEEKEAPPAQNAPEAEKEMFIPIREDQPFPDLPRLEQGTCIVQDGQIGILLPPEPEDQISSTSPTGQWSEPSTSL